MKKKLAKFSNKKLKPVSKIERTMCYLADDWIFIVLIKSLARLLLCFIIIIIIITIL
jgi:hypothetical protein